ncbi:thiamine biosynthesis lipoprotein [Tenacibaculum adriaticum]|uniref:FAD:protein FMN transferase n=1 Tax=Tenacibaculum adriaticum TaxID=413713 RepID=A0A5S5E040_9FLAO|nr:FAD:protein FMN transferase [Tenacibaculum adriaticum]TYQ00130.1 thiamine biosynthesis lipoprotein [Tenacibaculum adriaticum]
MKNSTFYYLIFLSVFLTSCKQEKNKLITQLQGPVFGTTYHITYEDPLDYQQSIDSLFYLVNKSLSTYMPTSDISRINKNDTTVVVDDLFIEVFNKSKKIYKETDGYFDVTVGNLVNAYGFGSKKGKHDLSFAEIADMMKLVGFDKVELKDRKIIKQDSGIEFDVNSIAKGFGIDVIARFLEQKNIQNYLVEIGGEIRCKGLKEGKPWRVAIEKPNIDGTQSIQKTIELTNKSMATSGNYRKYRVGEDGKKYVHILNPLTGLAQESNLLSASVIAEKDCADVDAYATAFMAMGLEKTKEFLEEYNEIKVILLYANEEGKIVEFTN